MEIKEFEGEVPKDGWKATGNVRERDARKILKHLIVRSQVVAECPNKILWSIQRNRTKIMIVETDASISREQILLLAERLEIKGFKEAFEKALAIPIPQEYIDEVGWEA